MPLVYPGSWADLIAVAEGMACAPDLLGYVPISKARDGVVHYHHDSVTCRRRNEISIMCMNFYS